MRITRSRVPHPSTYNMMRVELGKVDECKYLGIILQHDLRWNKQSIHATRKATKILNFVRRNFHHTSQSIRKSCIIHWYVPTWIMLSQRGIPTPPKISTKLKMYRNVPLDLSQIHMAVTQASLPSYNHSIGLTSKNVGNSIAYSAFTRYIMIVISHPKKSKPDADTINNFKFTRPELTLYANSFFPRTVKEWNYLPTTVINKPSPDSFKSALEALAVAKNYTP